MTIISLAHVVAARRRKFRLEFERMRLDLGRPFALAAKHPARS